MDDKVKGLIELIEEKSGENVIVYDVNEITTIAKYIFIITANSQVHAGALANHIMEYISKTEKDMLNTNKKIDTSNPWILIDSSDFVFHIFQKEEREFYQLEKLYFRGKNIV